GWMRLFFFSSRRRHTSSKRDWSSDVCSSDLFVDVDDRAEDETTGQDDLFQVDDGHREDGEGTQQTCADARTIPPGHRHQQRGFLIHGVIHGTRIRNRPVYPGTYFYLQVHRLDTSGITFPCGLSCVAVPWP